MPGTGAAIQPAGLCRAVERAAAWVGGALRYHDADRVRLSTVPQATDEGPRLAILDRSGLVALLLLPVLLLHAHGIAEGAIAVIDLCFLARSVLTRDWQWLRTPWLSVGF